MLSVAQVLWIHLIWAMNCLQMFSFVSAINDKLKSWRIFVCTFEPSCYVTLQETKVNSTSQEAREKSFVLFKEISLFASFLTHEIAIFQWNSDRIATALMSDVEISCFLKPFFFEWSRFAISTLIFDWSCLTRNSHYWLLSVDTDLWKRCKFKFTESMKLHHEFRFDVLNFHQSNQNHVHRQLLHDNWIWSSSQCTLLSQTRNLHFLSSLLVKIPRKSCFQCLMENNARKIPPVKWSCLTLLNAQLLGREKRFSSITQKSFLVRKICSWFVWQLKDQIDINKLEIFNSFCLFN